jgi:shikimate kinase
MSITHSNIALYGFMGSGKSTIGKKLSVQLDMSFIDLDSFIEEQESVDIRKIFTEYGETVFRSLELKALRSILDCTTTPHVLSLGGGTLLQEEAEKLVCSSYRVLTLSVPFSILEKRINASERPLRSQARLLFDKRTEHYQNVGKTISMHTMSVEESVAAVVEVLHAA